MARRLALLLLCLPAALAPAQDEDPAAEEEVEAGDAITLPMCSEMRDEVLPGIETFLRLKFRRPVPLRVQPKAEWDAWRKQQEFTGLQATHTLAYYRPDINEVTVVPWVIGGYADDKPARRTRAFWREQLEPTMIHELTHAIHHQNFFTEGRHAAASMKNELTEEELDRSTVDFVVCEGLAELVALRTTAYLHRMDRYPHRELSGPTHYLRSYRSDGKQPYRLLLLEKAYDDGLDFLHHLQIRAGTRGVRAILYRPPPRELLFQPEILATVSLDDPPDPDSVFGFLAQEVPKGTEVRLAVDPGFGRIFGSGQADVRVEGCLVGYVAQVGEEGGPWGLSRYAFWLCDPDHPASWRDDQAAGLKALNPDGAAEREASLPGVGKIRVLKVPTSDGGLYLRADAEGLVVLAHESRPTPTLEERAVLALRALLIRKPTPKLYEAALAAARAAREREPAEPGAPGEGK